MPAGEGYDLVLILRRGEEAAERGVVPSVGQKVVQNTFPRPCSPTHSNSLPMMESSKELERKVGMDN